VVKKKASSAAFIYVAHFHLLFIPLFLDFLPFGAKKAFG